MSSPSDELAELGLATLAETTDVLLHPATPDQDAWFLTELRYAEHVRPRHKYASLDALLVDLRFNLKERRRFDGAGSDEFPYEIAYSSDGEYHGSQHAEQLIDHTDDPYTDAP